jgi:hypothetical protein
LFLVLYVEAGMGYGSFPGSSDQGAAADRQCLKKMISRAVLVPDGENPVVINA